MSKEQSDPHEVATTSPFGEKENQQTSHDNTTGFINDGDTPDVIKRGMPKKNLKTMAIIVGGVIFMGVMVWAEQGKKPADKKVSDVAQTQEAVVNGIIDKLEGDGNEKLILEQRRKDDEFKLAAASATPPPSLPPLGMSAAPMPQAMPVAGSANGAMNGESTRTEVVNASSMTPNDFDLGTAKKMMNAMSGSQQPMQQQKTMEQIFLETQERANQQTLMTGQQGQQQGGANQQRNASSDFISNAGKTDIMPADRMYAAPPEFSLHEGTFLRGVLTNGINTEVPGEFRAKVVSDLFDSKTMKALLIPRGSTIIGAYKSSILVGQGRMVVVAQRLILPNGKSINLRGSVLGDNAGVAGMPGEIDNHFWDMFKASAIVGAASMLLPRDQQTVSTVATPSGVQAGGSIIGMALSDTLTRIAQRNSNIGPTGSLESGAVFTMMIKRDIAMEPYKW